MPAAVVRVGYATVPTRTTQALVKQQLRQRDQLFEISFADPSHDIRNYAGNDLWKEDHHYDQNGGSPKQQFHEAVPFRAATRSFVVLEETYTRENHRQPE
jgi:hypothetical protein